MPNRGIQKPPLAKQWISDRVTAVSIHRLVIPRIRIWIVVALIIIHVEALHQTHNPQFYLHTYVYFYIYYMFHNMGCHEHWAPAG